MIFNGNEIKKAIFNGQALKKIVFNGNTIFTSITDMLSLYEIKGYSYDIASEITDGKCEFEDEDHLSVIASTMSGSTIKYMTAKTKEDIPFGLYSKITISAIQYGESGEYLFGDYSYTYETPSGKEGKEITFDIDLTDVTDEGAFGVRVSVYRTAKEPAPCLNTSVIITSAVLS